MKQIEKYDVWNAIIDASGIEYGHNNNNIDDKIMILVNTIVATGKAFGHLTVNSEACTYINNRLWANKIKDNK